MEAVHWQDVAQMITAATGADLMVLGGGGLFQDHHGFDEKHVLTPDHGRSATTPGSRCWPDSPRLRS